MKILLALAFALAGFAVAAPGDTTFIDTSGYARVKFPTTVGAYEWQLVKLHSGSGGGGASYAFRAISATRDTVKSTDGVLGLSGSTPDTIQIVATTAGRFVYFVRTDNNTAAHLILGSINGGASYAFSWAYEDVVCYFKDAYTCVIVGGH
jgi:hypothetical protein